MRTLGVAWLLLVMLPFVAAGPLDFGLERENELFSRAMELFGVNMLRGPAAEADYVPREKATADQRVKLAPGLKAEFVARNVEYKADMIAFFPSENNHTPLIVCNEDGRSETGTNPGVQRIRASDGLLETIVFGMDRCDGPRTTAWGTVLATEETDDGAAYEIFNPLSTTNDWIRNRDTGRVVTQMMGRKRSKNIFKRNALPIMAWEGLTIMKSGIIYAGDELRPGADKLDDDGGAIFKFVPKKLYTGGPVKPRTSPFVSGRTFAMRVSCSDTESSCFPQYGQGCEIGVAAWVKVYAPKARQGADLRGATGYYRPEDLHVDPSYRGPGIRWCVANTGNADAGNPGEVICVVDETPEGKTLWTDRRTRFRYQSRNEKEPLTDGSCNQIY